MLNAGKFVAPLIFALVKSVPVMVAPEKFAFVSVAPEKETPDRVVPTNDAPDKFKPAKLVPGGTVCPASSDPTALITIEHVVFVGALYSALAAWEAVIVTVPAAFNVTKPLLAPTVANAVLLLLYVTEPELALLATTVNAASVKVFVVGGLTNVSVGVAFETVSVLLALVALKYCAVCACVALNDTSPTPTNVIQFPEASMVATAVLLLLYVIAPLLLLVGRVPIENDASPNVLDDSTMNVADEKVETSKITSKNTIPLELIPSPPYKVYEVPFIVALVVFVYELFASRL